jgi:hypothetical protein
MTSRRGLEGELDVDLSTATRYSIPYQIYLSRNHLHARERGRRELALRCEPVLVRGRRQPAWDAARGPAVAPAARDARGLGGQRASMPLPPSHPALAGALPPTPDAPPPAQRLMRRAFRLSLNLPPRPPPTSAPPPRPEEHTPRRRRATIGRAARLARHSASRRRRRHPLAAIPASPTLSGVVAARKLDHHSTLSLGAVARAHARGDAAAGRAHRRPLMSAPRAPVPFALARLPPIPLPRLSPRSHLSSDLYNSMCK